MEKTQEFINTPHFLCSTCDEDSPETDSITASYKMNGNMSFEDYEEYFKIFKKYLKSFVRSDITEVVSDIRSLFSGTEETHLSVDLRIGNTVQRVLYSEGEVSCYFESSTSTSRTVVYDNENGFKAETAYTERHLTSETEEQLVDEAKSFIKRIEKLQESEPNIRTVNQNIFGYDIETIKRDKMTFEFERGPFNVEINAIPHVKKKLKTLDPAPSWCDDGLHPLSEALKDDTSC